MRSESGAEPRRPAPAGDRQAVLAFAGVAESVATPAAQFGAGVVAGGTLSLAAALVELGCRWPRPGWADAGGAAAQADTLRRRALRLTEAHALAYAEARRALAGEDDVPVDRRDAHLGAALSRAAHAPLVLTEVAADVAHLAGEVIDEVGDAVRHDVACAAALAVAVARAGAHLVEVNLAVAEHDPRRAQAWAFAREARGVADRVFAAPAGAG